MSMLSNLWRHHAPRMFSRHTFNSRPSHTHPACLVSSTTSHRRNHVRARQLRSNLGRLPCSTPVSHFVSCPAWCSWPCAISPTRRHVSWISFGFCVPAAWCGAIALRRHQHQFSLPAHPLDSSSDASSICLCPLKPCWQTAEPWSMYCDPSNSFSVDHSSPPSLQSRPFSGKKNIPRTLQDPPPGFYRRSRGESRWLPAEQYMYRCYLH